MYIENTDLKSQDDYEGIFIHTTLKLNDNNIKESIILLVVKLNKMKL